jgi:hypothetical protein
MSAQPSLPTPYEALKTYEKAVYQRLPDSQEALFTVVRSLMSAGQTSGLMLPGAPLDVIRAMYTRFAAAMTTQLLTPGFTLDKLGFYTLCSHKIVIESAFALSGFADAQHLLDYLQETDAQGASVLKLSTVFITSLFFSLDNIPDPLFDATLGLSPDILMPLMIGWLSTHRVLTPEGEARRVKLLAAHERIAGEDFPVELSRALSHAWMYCTYADTPNQHAVKATLNKLLLNVAKRDGATARWQARRIVKRPRLVIPAERWRSNHAMYRSYSPIIATLRERFHLILVADQTDFDENSAQMFDEVHAIQQQGIRIRDILAAIIKLKPDVIYYPSLGMSVWTVIAANFRLAPVQIMTAGHPATSMSDHVDYIILGASGAEGADSAKETVVLMKGNGCFEPHPELPAELPDADRPARGDTVHIAVHGSAMKLTARFLKTCGRLIKESTKPLHFHFFPGSAGVGMDDLRIRLPMVLEGAQVTVYPYMRYTNLLNSLQGCDLALAPYPFGNTNSTVDCSLVGLPVVCFKAPYIHCLGDKTVFDLLGMPEWLLTTTDEEYFATAMRLITDRDALSVIREQVRAIDPRARLFSLPEGEDPLDFLETITWIYENHEALQASSRHCFTRGETVSD